MRNKTPFIPLILIPLIALTAIGCLVTDLITTLNPNPVRTPSAELAPLVGAGTPAPFGGEQIIANNVNRMTLLARLGNAVTAGGVAWSPDGRMLAFPSTYGVYLFDAETLAQIRFIAEPARLGSDSRPIVLDNVAFSSDGNLLAYPNAGSIRLRRVADGSLVRDLQGGFWVNAVFSPDGVLMAMRGSKDSVRLVRVSDGTLARELTKLADDGDALQRVRISPDWSVMATWSMSMPPLGQPLSRPIRLWRVSDGTMLRDLKDVGTGDITFSPDGTQFVSTSLSFSKRDARGLPDQSSAITAVRVWRVSDGSLAHEWQAPFNVLGVAVSPDNNLLALTDGVTLRLVRVSDGSPAREFKGESTLAAFSPDGSLLASKIALRLWRVSDGSLARESKDWYSLGSASFSSDASLLVTNSSSRSNVTAYGPLRVWRIATDTSNGALTLAPMSVLAGARDYGCPVFSSDKRLLITSNSQGSQLWRTDNGALVREWKARYCNTVFSPDTSLLATVTDDYVVQLLRVSNGSLVWQLQDQYGFTDAWFSPDATMLVTKGLKGGIRFTHVNDGALAWEVKGATGGRVTFSPDGSLVLFQNDKDTVLVRRVRDGNPVRDLKIASGGLMTFSPDGNLVASSGSLYQAWVGDDTLRLWRVSDWNQVRELRGATGIPVFSPDGMLLATRGSKELGLLQLWRVSDGTLLREFKGQRDYIETISFSQDGRVLISGSTDGTLALWGIAGK